MSHEENIPDWVYTKDRPASNEEYFENLTRCIFQGGLNWTMIANKWSNFRESFDNFDINKIASYGLDKQEELMNNKDIIRNKQKIMATIHNAEEFQRIAEKHGSFQKWLDSMNKSNNMNTSQRDWFQGLNGLDPLRHTYSYGV